MAKPDLSLTREFEAALAWWRAAGVDCDFADDATAWLAKAPIERAAAQALASPAGQQSSASAATQGEAARLPAVRPAPASAPEPAAVRRNLLGDSPPGDLAKFRQWWLDNPELDAPRLAPRIAPRGQAGAALMVLVAQPEEQDSAQLLEGPQGRLLANILAAMGLDESAVYMASALPCHTPMADLAMIGASGMDAVLAHHIALAGPGRILAFGADLGAILTPLKDEPLRKINQMAVNTPVMVSETLEAMLHMPRLKTRFWRRWMEWSASH